jgi:hypothetical protein
VVAKVSITTGAAAWARAVVEAGRQPAGVLAHLGPEVSNLEEGITAGTSKEHMMTDIRILGRSKMILIAI